VLGLVHYLVYGPPLDLVFAVEKTCLVGSHLNFFIIYLPKLNKQRTRNTKGGSITVPLASCLTGLESAVTTDNFCFYLQNRLIQPV
jgi:hypothetical protein